MLVTALVSFHALVAGILIGYKVADKGAEKQAKALYAAYLDEMYKRLRSERQFRENAIKPRDTKVRIIGR